MKLSLHFILAFGIILAFAACAWTEEVEDVKPETDVESRSGNTQDKVQPRVHALLAGHHHHLHAHHSLAHHAMHHPILTKKLLLLKFKGLGMLAHHHHHHPHHMLHHALFHHHHLFRSNPGVGSDSVVEVIPVSDPTGSAFSGVSSGLSPSSIKLVGDTPTVQAYAVPAEYLQGVSDSNPEQAELDNYEELTDDVPEISPYNKHLLSSDGVLDQAPIYLYAVPQQLELGRSATRMNKNRRKFKN